MYMVCNVLDDINSQCMGLFKPTNRTFNADLNHVRVVNYVEREVCEEAVIVFYESVLFCSSCAEKQIDLNNVDLKKLKVKELKKILSQWGEECRGCAEKSDYISRINDLKPLHVEL